MLSFLLKYSIINFFRLEKLRIDKIMFLIKSQPDITIRKRDKNNIRIFKKIKIHYHCKTNTIFVFLLLQ